MKLKEKKIELWKVLVAGAIVVLVAGWSMMNNYIEKSKEEFRAQVQSETMNTITAWMYQQLTTTGNFPWQFGNQTVKLGIVQ